MIIITPRTDMAFETDIEKTSAENGIKTDRRINKTVTVTDIEILNETGERITGKPKGRYITVENDYIGISSAGGEELLFEITNAVKKLLDNTDGTVLVAGLGNSGITPDALGPLTAKKVLATRHIADSLKKELGLEKLKSVAVLIPGVLGQTGMETKEIISGALMSLNIKALVVVDAFAASKPGHICRSVQISNAGISPGSGVGNSRKEISLKTVGIPVVSVGMPTVVDFASFGENDGMNTLMVTPRNIDELVLSAASLIAAAINSALQPDIEREVLDALV